MIGSPPQVWRETKGRLHGYTEKPCCRMIEIRKTTDYKPCPNCGTVTTYVDGGNMVTMLGQKWFESKLGIPVDINVRKKINV